MPYYSRREIYLNFYEFTQKYYKQFLKKLNKKYYSKGWAIYVPHRRSFNSALAILEDIRDIPFEKLTLELYFLISDKNFEKIANDYKRAIEIAKKYCDKDAPKFINGVLDNL